MTPPPIQPDPHDADRPEQWAEADRALALELDAALAPASSRLDPSALADSAMALGDPAWGRLLDDALAGARAKPELQERVLRATDQAWNTTPEPPAVVATLGPDGVRPTGASIWRAVSRLAAAVALVGLAWLAVQSNSTNPGSTVVQGPVSAGLIETVDRDLQQLSRAMAWADQDASGLELVQRMDVLDTRITLLHGRSLADAGSWSEEGLALDQELDALDDDLDLLF